MKQDKARYCSVVSRGLAMYELKWFDKLRGPSRCQVFLAHMHWQNRCSSGVVVYGCSQRSQFGCESL